MTSSSGVPTLPSISNLYGGLDSAIVGAPRSFNNVQRPFSYPAYPPPQQSPSSAKSSPHPESHDRGDGLVGVEGTAAAGGDASKRKRNRPALSCASCKKRKIKCDRKIPCEACIKRGDGESCHWEDPKREAPPQAFGLASDVEWLIRRVMTLETVVTSLPPELTRNFRPEPIPPNFAAGSVLSHVFKSATPDGNAPHTSNAARSARSFGSDVDSDTEDAALVLEELAMGKKRRLQGSGDLLGEGGTPNSGLHSTRPPSDCVANSDQSPVDATARAEIPPHILLGPRYKLNSNLRPARPGAFARDALIDGLYACLPKPEICDFLVDWFFGHLHVFAMSSVLHPPTFAKTYAAFWCATYRGVREVEGVDLLWMAILFLVLCQSAFSIISHKKEGEMPGRLAAAQILELTKTWFEASQIAMSLGEWSTKPRARSCQAILLLFPVLQLVEDEAYGPPAQKYMVWLSAGIRIAHLMGLHQLGPDEENRMPADDPAWPPGENCIKRELAKRIFHYLVFADWMSAASLPPRATYLIAPDSFDTPLPMNVNDTDLGDWPRTMPRPDSEFTDTSISLFKMRMAAMQRQVADVYRSKKHVDYSRILEIEAGFRASLDHIPAVCRLGAREEDELPKVTIARAVMHQATAYRLLRLHARYVHRGMKDHKYAPSVATSREAAEIVLTCMLNAGVGNTSTPHAYSLMALLSAVSIFAITAFDALEKWNQQGNETVAAACLQHLDQSATVLRSQYREQLAMTALRRVTEAAIHIVESLAIEVRSALTTVRDDGTPFKGQQNLAMVIKRISENLAACTEPIRSDSSGTPPTLSACTPGSSQPPTIPKLARSLHKGSGPQLPFAGQPAGGMSSETLNHFLQSLAPGPTDSMYFDVSNAAATAPGTAVGVPGTDPWTHGVWSLPPPAGASNSAPAVGPADANWGTFGNSGQDWLFAPLGF